MADSPILRLGTKHGGAWSTKVVHQKMVEEFIAGLA